MTKIRTVSTAPYLNTYQSDSISEEALLENFLWKLLLLTAMAYFVWSEKIAINIGPFSIQKTEIEQEFSLQKTGLLTLLGFNTEPRYGVMLESDLVDNLTFAIDPSFAKRHNINAATVDQRMQQCSLFVKRFRPVAIAEMRRFGIPASILLAQALLASNAGEDEIACKTNNFFLRNCSDPDCALDHEMAPASLEDAAFVEVFPNLWGSFRSQSLYLRGTEPFSNLLGKDFQTWANALELSGYSTDPAYGKKLIALIYALKLNCD